MPLATLGVNMVLLHNHFTPSMPTPSNTLSAVAVAATLLCGAASTAHAGLFTPKPTEAQTRYPLVLVHGLMGFDDILGLDYFYQIPADLSKNGATVLVAKVSAVNDNDVRGEQLLKQLKEWQAAKGYTKFNLIGHSQGGPTARYAAGIAPGLIASVTTVGSPHTIPVGGRHARHTVRQRPGTGQQWRGLLLGHRQRAQDQCLGPGRLVDGRR